MTCVALMIPEAPGLFILHLLYIPHLRARHKEAIQMLGIRGRKLSPTQQRLKNASTQTLHNAVGTQNRQAEAQAPNPALEAASGNEWTAGLSSPRAGGFLGLGAAQHCMLGL